MNCNFYWQPAPISLIPTHPTCLYIDQSLINTTNHIDFEYELKQMKKKCKELELENSELKEEISILEVSFRLISENETEKRQKNRKEKKGIRARQEIQMLTFQLQKRVRLRPGP
jgi:hypothetical protein